MEEKEYLSGTKCCDVENPEIKLWSFSLTRNCNDEIEKSIRIFDFVREKIEYRFDFPSTKASETLKKRKGNCFNKANLQIALLRSAGIPAGYHVVLIKKEVFRPIVPPEIYELINQPTVHVFACCLLENRWVSADATIDRRLFTSVYSKIEGWEYKKWDGKNEITIDKRFIVEDQGIYSNIDLYLLNPPRFWNENLLRKANEYLEGLLKR